MLALPCNCVDVLNELGCLLRARRESIHTYLLICPYVCSEILAAAVCVRAPSTCPTAHTHTYTWKISHRIQIQYYGIGAHTEVRHPYRTERLNWSRWHKSYQRNRMEPTSMTTTVGAMNTIPAQHKNGWLVPAEKLRCRLENMCRRQCYRS